MKYVLRIALTFLIVLVILQFSGGFARADGTVVWGGNGSVNLPCEFGAHWNLVHGDDIVSAVIYVNGTAYPMSNHGGSGTWDADSSGYLPSDPLPSVHVEYSGGHEPNDYFITLSHCVDGATPTFTPTFTPTNTPTFTPSFTPTDTPTYTSTPTDTPTFTPTNTPTFTSTPTDTPTNTPTDTPTNTPTGTLTPTDTPTSTPFQIR